MFHSALKMGNSGILMYVPHYVNFNKIYIEIFNYHVKKGHSLHGKGPPKVQINAFWTIIGVWIGVAKFENIWKETFDIRSAFPKKWLKSIFLEHWGIIMYILAHNLHSHTNY